MRRNSRYTILPLDEYEGAVKRSPISRVMTVNEVVRELGVHRKTVIRAVDRGALVARVVDGIYLIDEDSAYALWGKTWSQS